MRESRIHQTPRLIIHQEEVHRVMPHAKHDELALLLQQVLDHVVDLGRPTDVDGLVAAPAQHALLRREVTVVVGVVAGVRLGLLALALASPRGVRHLDHRGRDAGLATLRIPSRQEDIKTRKHCASHRGSCILPRHHDKKALRIPSRFMHLVAVHASRRGSCIQEDIKTSRHQGIKASRHRDIKTSRHQDIKTSRHQDIKTSRHQGIETSRISPYQQTTYNNDRNAAWVWRRNANANRNRPSNLGEDGEHPVAAAVGDLLSLLEQRVVHHLFLGVGEVQVLHGRDKREELQGLAPDGR